MADLTSSQHNDDTSYIALDLNLNISKVISNFLFVYFVLFWFLAPSIYLLGNKMAEFQIGNKVTGRHHSVLNQRGKIIDIVVERSRSLYLVRWNDSEVEDRRPSSHFWHDFEESESESSGTDSGGESDSNRSNSASSVEEANQLDDAELHNIMSGTLSSDNDVESDDDNEIDENVAAVINAMGGGVAVAVDVDVALEGVVGVEEVVVGQMRECQSTYSSLMVNCGRKSMEKRMKPRDNSNI